MTKASSPDRKWFLKDEPLPNLEEQDRFSHSAYVNLLGTTVDELTPPFTLGVFGSWGVGKSSIVNDLSKKLMSSNSKTRAVTIDVWKYSDDSLRRQFLYDLQQGLREQKALSKSKDYVHEVYQENAEERPGDQRLEISRLWALAVPLLLTFLITGAGIGLLLALSFPNPLIAILASIVAPAALFLVSEFTRSVVVVSKDTITRPVYFSEDQFERKFEEIVKDAKCSKLVIIVDNLDRCSHDLVVGTLSTIKTFLEPKGEQKCIFVIPCDDSAIRQHVKAAYRVISDDKPVEGVQDPEQYAIEYLRKFFSGSIKIDPFLPEEIELYIEHLLTQIKLTEDLPDEETRTLVQIVGFLFRENPRQLKQILNNLTSKYLLAKERESGTSPQINPPITDERLFLAKIVAIETRFPEIYNMFRNDDNLFQEVHLAAVNPSRAGKAESLLNKSEGWELLESFLRTTGHITAENPKAFFHLKQSEQEARIPNYAQFDSALRRGSVRGARSAYDSGDEESNAARTEVLLRDIEDWSQKGYESYALNAIQVAMSLRTSPKADGSHLSGEVVRVFATTPALLQQIRQIRDPKAIFEMTEHALPVHRQVVHEAYVEYFTRGLGSHQSNQSRDGAFEDSIAETLVAHIKNLSPALQRRIRTAISESNNIRPEQLKILSSTQEAIETLIDSTALIKAVGNVRTEELAAFVKSSDHENGYDSTFQFLIRCQELGDQAFADETVQKLLELLEFASSYGDQELFSYTCTVASDFSALFRVAEPAHLDGITTYLCQQYHLAQPRQKAKLVEFMCRYYERISDGSKDKISDILISDFIPSIPSVQLGEFLALYKDQSLAAVPWEQLNDSLAERLITAPEGPEANDLLTSITSALVPDGYELLMKLASRMLNSYEATRSVEPVEHLVSELPGNNMGKGLAVPVIEVTLDMHGHMNEPQNKRLLLEFAFRHHRLHTKGYERKLDDHVFDLIVDGRMQEVGLQVLDSGYEMDGLSEGRYVAILQRVAQWLMLQPATTPLPGPILEGLGKIVSQMSALPDDDNRKGAMMQWLSDRQEEALPPDERKKTLAHLTSFGQVPDDVLQQLIPRLVYQAQNFPDESTRGTIVESLLTLYENNSPLDPELWRDLNDYRRSLMNGDDMQKTAGRRLDRRMRNIRNSAQ